MNKIYNIIELINSLHICFKTAISFFFLMQNLKSFSFLLVYLLYNLIITNALIFPFDSGFNGL